MKTEIENLIEIVEGVTSVRWQNPRNNARLKDTPEWCAFYVAAHKQSDARADLEDKLRKLGYAEDANRQLELCREENRQMREILDSALTHGPQGHFGQGCEPGCYRCRWEALKKEGKV